MAARLSKSGDVQPYQYEPTYAEGELPDLSEGEEDISEKNCASRVGGTEWCSCGHCSTMESEVESICCQELDVLNEKFDDSGELFLYVRQIFTS